MPGGKRERGDDVRDPERDAGRVPAAQNQVEQKRPQAEDEHAEHDFFADASAPGRENRKWKRRMRKAAPVADDRQRAVADHHRDADDNADDERQPDPIAPGAVRAINAGQAKFPREPESDETTHAVDDEHERSVHKPQQPARHRGKFRRQWLPGGQLIQLPHDRRESEQRVDDEQNGENG